MSIVLRIVAIVSKSGSLNIVAFAFVMDDVSIHEVGTVPLLEVVFVLFVFRCLILIFWTVGRYRLPFILNNNNNNEGPNFSVYMFSFSKLINLQQFRLLYCPFSIQLPCAHINFLLVQTSILGFCDKFVPINSG